MVDSASILSPAWTRAVSSAIASPPAGAATVAPTRRARGSPISSAKPCAWPSVTARSSVAYAARATVVRSPQRSRACVSVSPTRATSGSVKVTQGIVASTVRRVPSRAFTAATRA